VTSASDPELARGSPEAFVEEWAMPLLPQETREFYPSYNWEWWTWKVALGLSFTDSLGRRWKRLPNGKLTEITKRLRRSRKDFYNAWIAGELEHLDY
jgi:hypothetical protein